MKKVRYAFGAMAPTLGLAIPAAHTVAMVTASTGRTAKTVAMQERTATTATVCHSQLHASFVSKADFRFTANWSKTDCILQALLFLFHEQSGLEMRTRIYSRNGTKTWQDYTMCWALAANSSKRREVWSGL